MCILRSRSTSPPPALLAPPRRVRAAFSCQCTRHDQIPPPLRLGGVPIRARWSDGPGSAPTPPPTSTETGGSSRTCPCACCAELLVSTRVPRRGTRSTCRSQQQRWRARLGPTMTSPEPCFALWLEHVAVGPRRRITTRQGVADSVIGSDSRGRRLGRSWWPCRSQSHSQSHSWEPCGTRSCICSRSRRRSMPCSQSQSRRI